MILEVVVGVIIVISSVYAFPLFFRPLTRIRTLKDASIHKGGRLYSLVPPGSEKRSILV